MHSLHTKQHTHSACKWGYPQAMRSCNTGHYADRFIVDTHAYVFTLAGRFCFALINSTPVPQLTIVCMSSGPCELAVCKHAWLAPIFINQSALLLYIQMCEFTDTNISRTHTSRQACTIRIMDACHSIVHMTDAVK